MARLAILLAQQSLHTRRAKSCHRVNCGTTRPASDTNNRASKKSNTRPKAESRRRDSPLWSWSWPFLCGTRVSADSWPTVRRPPGEELPGTDQCLETPIRQGGWKKRNHPTSPLVSHPFCIPIQLIVEPVVALPEHSQLRKGVVL